MLPGNPMPPKIQNVLVGSCRSIHGYCLAPCRAELERLSVKPSSEKPTPSAII
jgi:hypothetical protein